MKIYTSGVNILCRYTTCHSHKAA